jgi:hypothetical protein
MKVKLNLVPLLLTVFSIQAFSVDYKVPSTSPVITDSDLGLPFNEKEGAVTLYKEFLSGELENELVDSKSPTDLEQFPDVEVEGEKVWLAFRVTSPKVRVVKMKSPTQTQNYKELSGFDQVKGSRIIVGYRAYGEFAIRIGKGYESEAQAAAVGKYLQGDARRLRIRFRDLDVQSFREEVALLFTDAEKTAGAKTNTIGFSTSTSTTESALFARLYSASATFAFGGLLGNGNKDECFDLSVYIQQNWAGMFPESRMEKYGECETLKDGSKQCHALKELILSEEVL